MITDLEIMNLHVRALFTHDAGSRIVSVNEPDGAIIFAPRLFLGRTRASNVWRFRADLSENICEKLHRLCADESVMNNDNFYEPLRHLEKYIKILGTDASVSEVSENNLAYRFIEYEQPSNKSLVIVTEKNAEVLQDGFEKLIEELPNWQPFIALVKENRAVSVCRSVRITREAHEAGVETLPHFRGKEYAKYVVLEWARLVRATGALPLYSTSWENTASQAVARKLNLKCYGVTFNIA